VRFWVGLDILVRFYVRGMWNFNSCLIIYLFHSLQLLALLIASSIPPMVVLPLTSSGELLHSALQPHTHTHTHAQTYIPLYTQDTSHKHTYTQHMHTHTSSFHTLSPNTAALLCVCVCVLIIVSPSQTRPIGVPTKFSLPTSSLAL